MTSELESQAQITDFEVRKFLLELINYEEEIDQELQEEALPEKRRLDLLDAKEIIRDNIQKIRMEGLL